MKILLLTVLLGALGLGSYLFAGAQAAPLAAPTCEASLDCSPEGNCLIRCSDAAGETCQVELSCEGGECRIVSCDGPGDCGEACPPQCPPQATGCCQKP